VIETPDITAVVVAATLWLVTHRPTYTGLLITTVVEPTVPSAAFRSVQVVPSAEYCAVKTSPLRVSFTHCGAVIPAVAGMLAADAPVVARQPRETPLPNDWMKYTNFESSSRL